MEREQTLIDRIQEAAERSTTRVEEIHQAIAQLPLDVLERNGWFEATARQLREVEERSIGAVYDTIREVNRRVIGLASDLLGGDSGAS
jgi:hypothetical protein